MDRVLELVCANCHVSGGVAQATTFRVWRDDSLATQQSITRHIDMTNAGASLILLKPLGQLPHGGGTQLSPGSEQQQILTEWVDRGRLRWDVERELCRYLQSTRR